MVPCGTGLLRCTPVHPAVHNSGTNFDLIETIAAGAFPAVTDNIYVHDHYLNKTAVRQMYGAFPKLLNAYGEIKQFSVLFGRVPYNRK